MRPSGDGDAGAAAPAAAGPADGVFVLALWLFRGRNCGYGQVMAKLADGLYHQRRGADLLAGQLDPGGGWMPGQGRR